jgi:hypothetical protein
VAVEEARLTHLAYAPEIAQAMLRRQQAVQKRKGATPRPAAPPVSSAITPDPVQSGSAS